MKVNAQSGDGARSKYLAAIDRLENQDPMHPEMLQSEKLREMLEEHGVVKINAMNVAEEAGLDRKAISGPSSRYPDIAARVASLKKSRGVGPSATKKIELLTKRLALAERRAEALLSRLSDIEIKLDGAKAEIQRLRAR